MYQIIIKGEAQTDYPNIEELDGIECNDDFAEYSDFSEDLEEGYMSFKLEDGKLITITEYIAKREFSEEELLELAKETQGQWSDGIGEGFEQFPCHYTKEPWGEDNSVDVFISPWFHGQKVEVKQKVITLN